MEHESSQILHLFGAVPLHTSSESSLTRILPIWFCLSPAPGIDEMCGLEAFPLSSPSGYLFPSGCTYVVRFIRLKQYPRHLGRDIPLEAKK